MSNNRYVRTLHKAETHEIKYPKLSIFAALLLIYMAPFVSSLLSYIAFVICIYRVVRYDAQVFATDYCLLLPLAGVFSTSGGFALLIWLCLFSGVWYVIRRGIQANAAYVFLIILLNYLILRMQTEIGNFVKCFSQLLMLCVLLPLQNEKSAERTAKYFCAGLIVSSVYALLLRNTWQLRAILGNESEAIWGTGVMRFMGLMGDPNYYMTMILLALALLVKLKDCGKLTGLQFWPTASVLTAFGISTYSKTFLLVFVLLGAIYIVWQLWNKKIISGTLLAFFAVIAALFLLYSEGSPVAVIMQRLRSAKNISDLTTGRMDIYEAYWNAISGDIKTFFFGKGMAEKELYMAAHNLYLEIWYFFGAVGLILFGGLYVSLAQLLKRRAASISKQNIISRNVVLAIVLVLFASLHGIFQMMVYGEFFLALLSLLITKKRQAADI